ncbi:hypothetical protein G5I_10402 [Acromyrmex echinatior]|uniref:Uncharacterized protein n=1 Tax=Acromyrmex echinatior TaxID=103372 RepID=F4WWT2_ACREC|nr:hypothetical protein G5I_10402 [Acromyrmex echinatior]
MGCHAKRLIGMLLLRPRCINCAATTLEYTMHFDPSHATLFGVVAYVASAKWVNLIYRGGNMYVDIDDETPTKELCPNVEGKRSVYPNTVCKNAGFCSLGTSLWQKSPYDICRAHERNPLRFLGSIMFVPEVQPFLKRNSGADAINAKYVLTVKEDGFGKICRGALFFIVAYVNISRQCYKMSNTESRISHEARNEERLLLSDAMEYLCLKQGQRVVPNVHILKEIKSKHRDSLIARQSTPISGYSVCTIKRCASQMRAVAREVFILRGVCSVIKRTGKRRQRVFRRCGKLSGRKKSQKLIEHKQSVHLRTVLDKQFFVVFNRDGRFVERLHRSCSREAAFQWQETKSEVALVCSELNGATETTFFQTSSEAVLNYYQVDRLDQRNDHFARIPMR